MSARGSLRALRARRWCASLAALLAAGCGAAAHRTTLLPLASAPPCETGARNGFDTGAVAWGGRGPVAVISDGHALLARRYDTGLTPAGDAHPIGEPAPPERVAATALPGGGVMVAVARPGDHALEVLRLDASGERAVDPTRVDEPAVERVQLAARGGDDGTTLLVYRTDRGVFMRWIGPTGRVSEPHACPAGVEPRTAIAWGSGMAALAYGGAGQDGAGASDAAVRLVLTNDACETTANEAVGTAAVNGTEQALLGIDERLYVAYGDRDQQIWLAVHDAQGGAVHPARIVARNATAPALIARREGVGLIQVRDDGAAQRLEMLVFDAALVQQAQRSVAAAEFMRRRFVAGDPWGGAWLGWEQPSAGASAGGAGPARLQFVARVCP